MKNPNRLLTSVLLHNTALALIGLGGCGAAATVWIFALSEVLRAPTALLLGVALLSFIATCVLGAMILIDAVRGEHERATRRRQPATWSLLAGVALMFLAALTN